VIGQKRFGADQQALCLAKFSGTEGFFQCTPQGIRAALCQRSRPDVGSASGLASQPSHLTPHHIGVRVTGERCVQGAEGIIHAAQRFFLCGHVQRNGRMFRRQRKRVLEVCQRRRVIARTSGVVTQTHIGVHGIGELLHMGLQQGQRLIDAVERQQGIGDIDGEQRMIRDQHESLLESLQGVGMSASRARAQRDLDPVCSCEGRARF